MLKLLQPIIVFGATWQDMVLDGSKEGSGWVKFRTAFTNNMIIRNPIGITVVLYAVIS